MLKGRGRASIPGTPIGHRSPGRAPVAKPEPDYEVVEFPSEQYVNAKLQHPPPTPPRPPTGHPMDTSCGLCGGGGARVRCTECGRRALCASCDDMYHRHPKRRHHQRQALPPSLLKEERPPLPPKGTPPVPPPRRHKLSGDRSTASPKTPVLDQRRATLNVFHGVSNNTTPSATLPHTFAPQRPPVTQMPVNMNTQPRMTPNFSAAVQAPIPEPVSNMGGFNPWTRPRTSLPGYNVPPQSILPPQQMEHWDAHENLSQNWGRPLRRGASVMELGAPACGGCAHCAPNPWRYGSCANLDHSWGQGQWAQTCCVPPMQNQRLQPHSHMHAPQTPQPYRRAESRAASRAPSRANSRAPSPALSMRSRASRRTRPRSPSPSIPSSDADSESEASGREEKLERKRETHNVRENESDLGPAPPPPSTTWQCEHCTYVNEPQVRVCVICCRTPTVTPKTIAGLNNGISSLRVTDKSQTDGSMINRKMRHESADKSRQKEKERISTSCGPSPPRDTNTVRKSINRLETPTKEHTSQSANTRHDIAVGPSPPKDIQEDLKQQVKKSPTPHKTSLEREPIKKHSVSVGPSPPRSVPVTKTIVKEYEIEKKTLVNPAKEEIDVRPESRSSRTSVANTGTSPPPQSISTQTYEVPNNNWQRPASAARSRPRRRFRDETRERSHSRHSLSSDTRESERSVRTTEGRWEWRESSPCAADWSENERKRSDRLTRRASHLDLRRTRNSRRTSLYGSEAPSPEPLVNNRAVSLEALAISKREAERGLELARLLTEAERQGFSAAEVQAALAQNPVAPLAWLRERWPSLVAGVRAAAARLASGVTVSELEARAALARHRGAMWPAVTECVERHRRQAGEYGVSEEGKLRGRVWGSPIGVDDEGAPPSFSDQPHRNRANDSSDEFEESITNLQDDDWMYLPLNLNANATNIDEKYILQKKYNNTTQDNNENIAENLKFILDFAGVPTIEESLLSKKINLENTNKMKQENRNVVNPKQIENIIDLVQSEKDFIDAYNALSQLSPLPKIEIPNNKEFQQHTKTDTHVQQPNGISQQSNVISTSSNNVREYSTNIADTHRLNESKVEQNITLVDPTPLRVLNTQFNSENNNKIKQDNLHLDNDKQADQIQDLKTNNLSDLVDTTQRLIQQMKDEITYDIKSHNSQQSDTHSSGSEPSIEHDFTDTDCENNTEDVTSEEKDTSSENEENSGIVFHEKVNSVTSSEDNEKFEEAIDYLDPDSLSEQDNVTLPLGIEHDSKTIIDNVKVPCLDSKDFVNSNLYAEVNSFEEIYDQLNNGSKDDNNFTKNISEISKKYVKDEESLFLPARETINIMTIKIDTPIKPIISEMKFPVLNAVVENTFELKDFPLKSKIMETGTVIETLNKSKQSVTNIENINTTVITLASPQELKNNQLSSNSNDVSKIHDEFDLENRNVELNSASDNPDTVIDTSALKNDTKPKQNVVGKSSIPVPIKTTIVHKEKVDKNQKLITSKLPVRRTSIKRYPAPAPPKAQLNNVQNGHVKQLQTQIFLNKTDVHVEKSSSSNTIDVIPSTSTIKKKAAPLPPQSEQQSPPKQPFKEKEQFFRETCRTEDEWTDSESENDIRIPKTPKEVTPTPEQESLPPITLRRVSGQLVDLTKVNLPEGSPERQARMLLAEGATENWDQARIAVELIAQGTDVATALLASLECTDLNSALAYLNQYCELCAAHYPEHEMVSMLRCSHRCCRECARHYFTVQITERSIVDCVCAYCKEPELENLDEDAWVNYFAHLDILLKTLLEFDVHELFQRKLRDRTLARDPNFRWCVECSSGFFVHPKQRKLRCPECKSVTCSTCRKPWSTNHDGISCEEYASWLEDNDPERSIAAVQQHLKENGLECPRCHFKYSLSRGGCMHFTCTQCKYEFCYGCGKPFMMGARCGLSEYCAKLGLHAHHPRNCLFYLRDKEPHELQTLLQMNNVAYEIEAPQGGNKRCPIQLQRETPAGLVDTTCGTEVLPNNAGLCKNHYLEYLSRLVRNKKIEPLPILGVDDLETVVRRAALRLPPRPYGSLEGVYKRGLIEIVKEKIPLD
ncbi:unnamed protein product [Leptosia nina]|uniref:RBR-type E3 ubiquitin transferase n=1 Tax=Leptosia nina TaxID=320188 RepID=A0AAV1JN09_9NEOP